MTMPSSTTGRALVAGLLLLVAAAAWVSPLDQPAHRSVEAGLKRALITFASARGLNAVISVVQGTEISIGVGASATFSVGEILDPVNDLVEKFSNLMLLASVSFGIQEVLLSIGEHAALKVAVTALLLGWGALFLAGREPRPWLNMLLLLALMLRFAIPVATVATDTMFNRFLAEKYQTGEAAIGLATASVREMTPDAIADPGPSADRSWWQDYSDRMKGLASDLDLRARLAALKASVEGAVEQMIWLMVVFLLQTLFIPLAILGSLYVVGKGALSSAGRASTARR